MDDPKGYALALLGALLGGFIPSPAITMSASALNSGNSVALGLLIFTASILVGWVGAPVGAWAALRLGKQPHAGKTAGLLIAVLVLFWICLTPLMMLTSLAYSNTGLSVVSVSVALLAPLLARRLATWRRFSRSAH